jgi:preprotein translocase subunit SecY
MITRLTAAGAVYLAVIAMLPMLGVDTLGAGSQFLYGGISLLIVVGVGLDTVKQLESQLKQHDYEGFLPGPRRPAGARHEARWNPERRRGIEVS